MCKKNCCKDSEIPLTELKIQLEYAQTIASDLFKVFSSREPNISDILSEYPAISSKLSMILDFVFQAKLWCDTLMPEENNI